MEIGMVPDQDGGEGRVDGLSFVNGEVFDNLNGFYDSLGHFYNYTIIFKECLKIKNKKIVLFYRN